MYAYDIHPQLAIHCFKNSCRYEPLVAKFKRDTYLVKTVVDAITIGKCYAEEDPNQGSDDDRDRIRRSTRSDDRRSELRYSNTRHTGGKRRVDYGSDLVATTNYVPRDNNKSSRYGGSGGNCPVKRFNADLLLDQPSKLAASRGPVPPGIFVEQLMRPSVEPKVIPGALATPTLGAPRTDATPGTSTSRGTTPAKPGEEPTPGNDDVMATERMAPSWATDIMQFMPDRTLPVNTHIFKSRCLLCHTSQSQEYHFCET